MFVCLQCACYDIDYEAEIFYINLPAKHSQIVNSNLLEVLTPDVVPHSFVYVQEVAKLKLEPMFSPGKSLDNLLICAKQNNISIFQHLANRGNC